MNDGPTEEAHPEQGGVSASTASASPIITNGDPVQSHQERVQNALLQVGQSLLVPGSFGFNPLRQA